MKKILVLLTGGTIASVSNQEGALTPDSSNAFVTLVDDLITREFQKKVGVDYFQVYNIDSSQARVGNYEKIAQQVYAKQFNYEAIIVMHGTDSMEYALSTLEFMSYDEESLLPRKQPLLIPVIFTGSMKPLQTEGSDAEGNIKTAFRSAMKFSEKNVPGFYLAFNQKIHSGLHVTKIHPSDVNAFSSNCHTIAEEHFNKIALSPFGRERIVSQKDLNKELQRIIEKGGVQLNKLKMKYIDKDGEMIRVFIQMLEYTPHIEISGVNPYLVGLIIKGLGSGNIPVFFSNMIKNRIEETQLPILLGTGYKFEKATTEYELANYAQQSGAILVPSIPYHALMAKMTFMMNCENSGVYTLLDFHRQMYHSYLGEEIKEGNPDEEIPSFIKNKALNQNSNFEKLVIDLRDYVKKHGKDTALFIKPEHSR